jgi:hypothetical protein
LQQSKRERSGFSVVEQWHALKPFVHEQAGDGLHYHSLLPNQIDGSFEISGPVVVYVLKMIANVLANPRANPVDSHFGGGG